MSLVLSTRPGGEDDPLVGRLRADGHSVVAVPTVATALLEPTTSLDREVGELGDGDWVVVTSGAGARAVLDASRRSGTDPGRCRWAAIGQGTAAPLLRAGISADLIPAQADPQTLASALASDRRPMGHRVLLARADLATGALPDALRASGLDVRDVVAYHTVEGPEEARVPLAHALAASELAAVVFASGSAVRGAIKLADASGLARLQRIALVSIGPSTSAVIVGCGLRVAAEARVPSVHGLVQAIRSVVRDRAATSREVHA